MMTNVIPYRRLVERRAELQQATALRDLAGAAAALRDLPEGGPELAELIEQLERLRSEIGTVDPGAVQPEQLRLLRQRMAAIAARCDRLWPTAGPGGSGLVPAGNGLARVLDHPGRHLGHAPCAG